jgi:hypothetical protein
MLTHKSDEIEAMHGIRVDEFAFADVFWGFGVVRVVGLRFVGPVETTIPC